MDHRKPFRESSGQTCGQGREGWPVMRLTLNLPSSLTLSLLFTPHSMSVRDEKEGHSLCSGDSKKQDE